MKMTEKFKREFLLYSNVATDRYSLKRFEKLVWEIVSFIEKLDTVRRWCFIKVNLSDANLVDI